MDVDKTIEFILASQARLEARFEAGEEEALSYAEGANAAAARTEAEMAEGDASPRHPLRDSRMLMYLRAPAE